MDPLLACLHRHSEHFALQTVHDKGMVHQIFKSNLPTALRHIAERTLLFQPAFQPKPSL